MDESKQMGPVLRLHARLRAVRVHGQGAKVRRTLGNLAVRVNFDRERLPDPGWRVTLVRRHWPGWSGIAGFAVRSPWWILKVVLRDDVIEYTTRAKTTFESFQWNIVRDIPRRTADDDRDDYAT
jgi:hypothetical protein